MVLRSPPTSEDLGCSVASREGPVMIAAGEGFTEAIPSSLGETDCSFKTSGLTGLSPCKQRVPSDTS